VYNGHVAEVRSSGILRCPDGEIVTEVSEKNLLLFQSEDGDAMRLRNVDGYVQVGTA
jgi:hypothetical protein